MSPFANYGAAVAPDRHRSPCVGRAQSALDRKMEERARLSKAYRASKRAERLEILQREPRLLAFMRYLRGVTADRADELLEAIENSDWLMAASQDVRAFALSRVARRQEKILLLLGEVPLDDPIPPVTSVFFKAQALLRRDGKL